MESSPFLRFAMSGKGHRVDYQGGLQLHIQYEQHNDKDNNGHHNRLYLHFAHVELPHSGIDYYASSVDANTSYHCWDNGWDYFHQGPPSHYLITIKYGFPLNSIRQAGMRFDSIMQEAVQEDQ